jgi:metallophosphoesterase superfamily enzyme
MRGFYIGTLVGALFTAVSAGVNGTTFFVVGDYGDVTNMVAPNMVFNAIDAVVQGAADESIDKPEFFIACGDNIYPSNPSSPTTAEFNTMLGLFQRPNIASLPVYAIRGNHDSYFSWTDEL